MLNCELVYRWKGRIPNMMKKIFKLLVLTVCCVMALTGCKLVKVDQTIDDNTVVAEYNGGTILKVDAEKEYNDVVSYYESSGYGDLLKDAEWVTSAKTEVLDYMVREKIFEAKAKEFGVDTISEDVRVETLQAAVDEYNQLLEMYAPMLKQEGQTDEEALDSARQYLEQYGYSEEEAKRYALSDYKSQMLTDYVTKDVTLSEDDLKKAYDEAVEADKASFTEDPSAFASAANYGETTNWVPEGFRTVKHILLKTSEELGAKQEDLEYHLSLVDDEIDARNNPDPEEDELTDGAEGDSPDIVNEDLPEEDGVVGGATLDNTGDEPVVTEPEVPTEDDPVGIDEPALDVYSEDDSLTVEPIDEDEEQAEEEDLTALTMEELAARKADLEKQIEDVKAEISAELEPRVKEVQDKIAAGEDFEALMEQYGEDPGMQSEPTKTTGYYISEATKDSWDPAFADAAMALAQVGDVSEPVLGQNGVHIIRYESDVVSGPADYEAVKESLRDTALENLKQEEYDRITQGWVDEAEVKLYPERL